MSRKLVASLLASLVIGIPLAIGCQGSAQMHIGTPEPEASSAPAVTTPPPASTTAEPAPTPEPVKVAAPAKTDVKQEGNKLKMPGAIVFETGKAIIKPESEPVLEQLRAFLEEKKQITLVRIEGHTDNVGQPAANMKLSGERALAVRTWLVNHNIEAKRLIAVGFGDTKPVADNKTEEGRSQNRRTEFVVVEVGGKPWLGSDPVGGGQVFGDNPRK